MVMKPQQMTPIRCPGIEIGEEPLVQDKLYVALGKDLNGGISTLKWALHNSRGNKICILHVHQPAQRIPLMGTKFSVKQLEEQQVRAYRAIENQEMNKLLDEYKTICDHAGVSAEVLHIEKDSVEKGILELISHCAIRKLVMGARASRRMAELQSKKAIYVCLKAPASCHIWFICKGQHVYTREGRLEGAGVGAVPPSLQESPSSKNGQHDWSSCLDYSIERPKNHGMQVPGLSSSDGSEGVNPRSPSQHSSSSRKTVAYAALASSGGIQGGLEPTALQLSKMDHWHPSPHSEGGMNDDLYDQLEQALAEAEKARKEALEESVKRRKEERGAIEANCRAKTLESHYAEQFRKSKEIEEAQLKRKEEIVLMKLQLDKLMEELYIAMEKKSSLENQTARSEKMVQELQQKVCSAVRLLTEYKKERDDLQVERDDAIRIAEELRKKQVEEDSDTLNPQFFMEFSFSEIEEATQNFDPSFKIGEGGYGSVYKCCVRHTQVAVKMLNPHSAQGPEEFQQEVNILSKLKHPNLVTLIGACPEAWILVYEYLPNGSLEDWLSCRDKTPPLSWQTRVRIAAELCSVLIFLHSCSPHGVVHGDLKPANILLDANYVSKLSDFGICRVLYQGEFSSNDSTLLCCRTIPKGTVGYMDPEFTLTGELTPKSDVYSFGIILLMLLTGRSALRIANEVQYALDKGTLKNLLDPTAGDWPFVQAKQLAHLALRCCEMSCKNRPDLDIDVWKVLEPMRVSCGASPSRMSELASVQIPQYFICPILQEIMQDPHVAADGYTYELEALRGWLDSGHDTSPVTKHKLPHTNLLPNKFLRYAIQEWLQRY